MKKLTAIILVITLVAAVAAPALTTQANAITLPIDWGAGALPVQSWPCRYDLNGGWYVQRIDGELDILYEIEDPQIGYYHTVIGILPTRALHRFDGWAAADGTVYHAGDRLPADVTELAAVWTHTWVLPKIDIKIPWK